MRKIRSAHGLSLKDHAARVGISASYLSALENGRRGVPTHTTLRRIIAALGVAPAEEQRLCTLVKLSDPNIIVNTTGLSPLATELANRLAEKIGDLTESELEEYLWMLQSAKNKRCG